MRVSVPVPDLLRDNCSDSWEVAWSRLTKSVRRRGGTLVRGSSSGQRNPTCGANTVSAVHNIRLGKAAEAAGLRQTVGLSPFALLRGNRFEASLFEDKAARLRAELERKRCLPEGSKGFLDLRLRSSGGERVTSVDDALVKTGKWLQRLADSHQMVPNPSWPLR